MGEGVGGGGGGGGYLGAYSPVFNCMYGRYMVNLSIIIVLHTNWVDFVLSYTQADVKIDISMELTIFFGVEGDHSR